MTDLPSTTFDFGDGHGPVPAAARDAACGVVGCRIVLVGQPVDRDTLSKPRSPLTLTRRPPDAPDTATHDRQ